MFRRILTAPVTLLTAVLLGPLAATFPLSVLPPFAIGAVVFAFPWAIIGGLALGLFFSVMPDSYYEEFATERWTEGSLQFAPIGAGFGLLANVVVTLWQEHSLAALISNGGFVLLIFSAYAGAAANFVTWPIARWVRGRPSGGSSKGHANGL